MFKPSFFSLVKVLCPVRVFPWIFKMFQPLRYCNHRLLQILFSRTVYHWNQQTDTVCSFHLWGNIFTQCSFILKLPADDGPTTVLPPVLTSDSKTSESNPVQKFLAGTDAENGGKIENSQQVTVLSVFL